MKYRYAVIDGRTVLVDHEIHEIVQVLDSEQAVDLTDRTKLGSRRLPRGGDFRINAESLLPIVITSERFVHQHFGRLSRNGCDG